MKIISVLLIGLALCFSISCERKTYSSPQIISTRNELDDLIDNYSEFDDGNRSKAIAAVVNYYQMKEDPAAISFLKDRWDKNDTVAKRVINSSLDLGVELGDGWSGSASGIGP